MSRIRIGEPLTCQISPLGLSGAAADLPSGSRTAPVRVTPEAHPSRTDPPVNLLCR